VAISKFKQGFPQIPTIKQRRAKEASKNHDHAPQEPFAARAISCLMIYTVSRGLMVLQVPTKCMESKTRGWLGPWSMGRRRTAGFRHSHSPLFQSPLEIHGTPIIVGTSASFQLRGVLGLRQRPCFPVVCGAGRRHAGRSGRVDNGVWLHRPRITLPSCRCATPCPHGRHDVLYGKANEVKTTSLSIYWCCPD
jgi:hypothetical protein